MILLLIINVTIWCAYLAQVIDWRMRSGRMIPVKDNEWMTLFAPVEYPPSKRWPVALSLLSLIAVVYVAGGAP